MRRSAYAAAAALLCAVLAAPGGAAAAPSKAPSAPSAPSARPTGWATAGTGTTGGAGAAPDSVHVVRTRAELRDALANHGDPTAPKVIRVRGHLNGNETDDGRLLGAQDYAPGWDLRRYMDCFGPDGTAWSDDRYAWCKRMRTLRVTGSNAQKQQIQLTVPSNTTILGSGRDAALLGVYLTVNTGRNIVIRNLRFEAPTDHFPSWDPGDGASGAWNARFDALSVVTGRNIWIDHCAFSDGRFPTSRAAVGFHGKRVEHHDGLLDMEDGTDFVTVSSSRFSDHEKTLLIGSGDGKGDRDRGHLRITFHHNLFSDTAQRSPRVRFGQVHTYNNYFRGSTDDPDYPMRGQALGGSSYFLGAGLESKIVSEYDVFTHTGPGASPDITVATFHGNQFSATGATYNGRRVDLNRIARAKFEAEAARARAEADSSGTEPPEWALRTFTTDTGWTPSDVYRYRPQRSAEAVIRTVLREAGPTLTIGRSL
ncbi:polysaccharide lyase family 1 protein [Streptomyces sp. NPDC007983]|uniref:pectate lyase family protein n=1 Tax=Streptomyces sp. NPDC007983 TaxID=3364800 RepID=UPI0036E7DB48